MKLKRLGEFGLIELLAKQIGRPTSRDVLLGIGDDAAVIKNGSKHLLITTDTFVENVHFRTKGISFKALGEKVLAANISDIAAMGGTPTYALVTIGANKNFQAEKIELLYRGLKQLAKKHKIDLVGGDTISSPKELIISITLLGEVEKEYLLTRAGAREGDLICVTGKFGGPAAGNYEHRTWNTEHRTREARVIAKSRVATSMIDSSDGLVRSVLEICRASKVGAMIWEDQVPAAKGATLDQALYGGEEYELVFTLPENKLRRLKVPLTVVGEIVGRWSGVKLLDKHDRIKSLKSGGYEHFL